MDIKSKIALGSLMALPIMGVGGGLAYASTSPPTGPASTAVQHLANAPDTAEAPRATTDAPGGPNLQQGPDVQQGGPDLGAAAEAPEAKSTEADAPGGANLQQGGNLQQ